MSRKPSIIEATQLTLPDTVVATSKQSIMKSLYTKLTEYSEQCSIIIIPEQINQNPYFAIGVVTLMPMCGIVLATSFYKVGTDSQCCLYSYNSSVRAVIVKLSELNKSALYYIVPRNVCVAYTASIQKVINNANSK